LFWFFVLTNLTPLFRLILPLYDHLRLCNLLISHAPACSFSILEQSYRSCAFEGARNCDLIILRVI
jgi:hypothetical protein